MQYTRVEVEGHLDHQTTRNFNFLTTGDKDTYTGEGGFAGKRCACSQPHCISSPPPPLKPIIKRSEEEALTIKLNN